MEARRSLRRLAEAGLAAFPPGDLDDLAEACEREAHGSLRLGSLAALCQLLRTYWDDGAVVAGHVAGLDEILDRLLPWVLDEPGEEEACALAEHLRDEVRLFMLTHPPL